MAVRPSCNTDSPQGLQPAASCPEECGLDKTTITQSDKQTHMCVCVRVRSPAISLHAWKMVLTVSGNQRACNHQVEKWVQRVCAEGPEWGPEARTSSLQPRALSPPPCWLCWDLPAFRSCCGMLRGGQPDNSSPAVTACRTGRLLTTLPMHILASLQGLSAWVPSTLAVC